MRTREQIVADCEKRFAELRAEKERRDNDPRLRTPCASCRFATMTANAHLIDWYCHEPLVVGFGKEHHVGTAWRSSFPVQVWKDTAGNRWDFPRLCGPEKALWQPKTPKLATWQRVKQWWGADTGGWPTLIALAASALALGVTWLA